MVASTPVPKFKPEIEITVIPHHTIISASLSVRSPGLQDTGTVFHGHQFFYWEDFTEFQAMQACNAGNTHAVSMQPLGLSDGVASAQPK